MKKKTSEKLSIFLTMLKFYLILNLFCNNLTMVIEEVQDHTSRIPEWLRKWTTFLKYFAQSGASREGLETFY